MLHQIDYLKLHHITLKPPPAPDCKGDTCLQILPEDSVQADVYQAAVQPVVEDVLNGYNGTIMAYGQTGAGKTYTLSSIQPEAIGMIPRAAAEVFAHIAADALNEYTVFMSYIQIYMEMIQASCASV